MAPIKQEDEMKTKLEKRSLTPSPEIWSKLSNRLDAEQQNKNKSKYWWFGIAASVVGILFVTTIYFNNQSIENNSPGIVNTKDNVIPKNENKIIDNQIPNQEVVETKNTVDKTLIDPALEGSKKTIISEKNQITNKVPQQEVIAQNDKAPAPEAVVQVDMIEKTTLTFEEQKIQDVVAQINDLKSNGTAVTDLEIENLLNKAQKEILSNRIYNNSTRMVDANALLQDVEDDLQQSFRTKVFEALQTGYESVRTAVAERNN